MARGIAVIFLVAILPLLLFGTSVAWVMVEQKRDAIASELAATARASQVAVDRELDSQLSAAAVLATGANLRAGDMADFEERLRAVLAGHPEWVNAVVIDARSLQIVASGLPFTPGLTTATPDAVTEVIANRKPLAAGVLTQGRVVKRPVIQFLVPVIADGQVRFVFSLVTDPTPLSRVLADQKLPATWTGAVIDHHLVLAGRSRAAERFIGVPATATLADGIRRGQQGMFTALNQEGAPV
ncbi:MAG: hypothetical protein JNM26_04650, partial [Ideonella sp.]|nr:hypothetical protein [Ideonella sp.]